MKSSLSRFFYGLTIVGFVWIVVGFWDVSPKAEGKNHILLFTLKETPQTLSENKKNSPASVRESEIDFDVQNFAGENLSSFEIPLFDNKTFLAVQNKSEGLEIRDENNFTWRGKIKEGKFAGDVILTFNQGFLNGLIYSPKAVYEIIAKGEKQILIELDQNLFPDCMGEVKPPIEKENAPIESVGAFEDSGDRIDVLVVYTDAVKTTVGGETQVQTLAQNAVDAANTAYQNSKIRQRLRLVHTEQTALTEANSLSDLRADATTQTLRNTHNADMVAMLVNSLSGCGIGYVMTNVSSGFAPSAYSITLRTCAVGNLTFAHELGHNMGSTHNPENGGSASFPYSYGHWVNGSYRTVMSYSDPCTSGCTRVPQFSNPAVSYNGVPTGIYDTRDNFRSLENTADTVANFRYSGSALRLDNFSENGFIPRNISKTINWSSNNVNGNVKIELSRNEGETWETVFANTPNDGSQTINIKGRPTKRARFRISSLDDANLRDSSIKNLFIK